MKSFLQLYSGFKFHHVDSSNFWMTQGPYSTLPGFTRFRVQASKGIRLEFMMLHQDKGKGWTLGSWIFSFFILAYIGHNCTQHSKNRGRVTQNPRTSETPFGSGPHAIPTSRKQCKHIIDSACQCCIWRTSERKKQRYTAILSSIQHQYASRSVHLDHNLLFLVRPGPILSAQSLASDAGPHGI